MTEPRWLDAREARAWRTYTRMRMVLHAELNRDLARSGLSEADYAVLVALSEAPEGRLRAFELVAETQWSKSRLSHQLARMRERDLVAKEDCPTDARGAYVVLTAHGRAAIEGAAPAHVESVRRHFIDVLEPDQLDRLAEIAEVVVAHLEH